MCLFSSGKRSKIYYREMNFDEVARLRKIIQHEPNSNHDKTVFQTFWKCSKNDWIMILNNFWTSQRSMRTFVHPQFLHNGKMHFCFEIALRMARFQKIWKFDRNTILMQDSEIAGIINATSTSGGIMLGKQCFNRIFLHLTPFWPLKVLSSKVNRSKHCNFLDPFHLIQGHIS